jgi:hypothetical protein
MSCRYRHGLCAARDRKHRACVRQQILTTESGVLGLGVDSAMTLPTMRRLFY